MGNTLIGLGIVALGIFILTWLFYRAKKKEKDGR